ncbi:MAG: hypothetical protein QXK18_04535 [Candidatus Bathyarchaeia archaeon]
MITMKMLSSEQIALIGEFYTVAQLYQRGFIASPTLGKTKHVDILVFNPRTGNRVLVEVKTTFESKARKKSKLFGENYEWVMDKKHEKIVNSTLFYCFVLLKGEKQLPRFFIVPSKDVAEYVKQEHEIWLNYRKEKIRKEMEKMKTNRLTYRGKERTMDEILKDVEARNPMRIFRIPINDPKKYEDNWKALDI